MTSTTGTSGTTGVFGAPPAPLGRRVGAALLDGLGTSLCAVPLWLASRSFAGSDGRSGSTGTVEPPATPSPALLIVGVVLLLAWSGVQWWCHGTRGWTIGRRILDLRTIDVRTSHPLGLGRALGRSLVVALGVLACGVGQLVVLASVLFDGTGKHRGWHDRAADAIVVDVRGAQAARRVASWDSGHARRPAAGTVPVTGSVPVTRTEPETRTVPVTETALAAGAGPVARPIAMAEPAVTAGPVLGSTPHGPAVSPAAQTDGAWSAPSAPGVPSPWPEASTDLPPTSTPTLAPAPEPSEPTRTRWSTLAAERQLDAPDLVLPPLGAPGLAPDVDTRVLPTVPSAGGPPPACGEPVPPQQVPAHHALGHAVFEQPTPGFPGSGYPASDQAADPLGLPDPRTPEPQTGGGRHAVRHGAPVHAESESALGMGHASGPGSASGPVPAPAPGFVSAPASAPGRVPTPGTPAAQAPPDLPPAEPFPFADPALAGSGPGGSGGGWAVRMPDGSVLPLDVPLLVGRNPDAVPGTRIVPVADPGRSVSKTHLLLGVDESGPWVTDRGSTNGTLVTLADGQRIVCLADRRVRLSDGSLVTFGDLSLSVGARA